MGKNKEIKEIDLHYNFISFPNKWYYPYNSKDVLPNHNEKNQGSFKNNGYIEYTIATNSKLTTDFRKNTGGEIFISGSEIRGRIRSNLEILSFSYPEFIEDKRILYRDFASDNPIRKKEYSKSIGINRSKKINEVVKVGYLQKIGNEYCIFPAKQVNKKNFLTIDEYKLINRYKDLNLEVNNRMYEWNDENILKKIDGLKSKEESLSLIIKKLRKITGLDKDGEFNKRLQNVYCQQRYSGCKWMLGKDIERKLEKISKALNGKVFYDLNTVEQKELLKCYIDRTEIKLRIESLWWEIKKSINKKFQPYEKDITYSIDENGGIKELRNADGNHTGVILGKGVLYCSNNATSKKRHYLIGEKDSENLLIVRDKLISSYNDNLKKFRVTGYNTDSQKDNKEYRKRIKDFYDIFSKEDCNKSKVVFYLTDEEEKEVINIGRTPYMKINYKNSIKDIIDRLNSQDKTNVNNISYAESIFGFTGKGTDGRQAYKSRVRFTNAIVKGNLFSEEKFFLPQPHASAFAMYLKQDNVVESKNIVSYANNIKDVKLRGYKFYKIRDKEKHFKYSEKYEEMTSIKKVLLPESQIEGKIYFNNLTDAELGLLLVSLDISLMDNDNVEYYELLGGAKAYGYGKCKASINNIYLEKEAKVRDLDDLGYEACKNYNVFIKTYKKHMEKLLEENSKTIEEYKLSKRVINDIDREYHYLDYISVEKEISAYEQHQVLMTLPEIINNSISKEDIATK